MKHQKSTKTIIRLLIPAFCCLTTACVQNNRPHWAGDWGEGSPNPRPTHAYDYSSLAKQSKKSDVIVIEFDDQGDFWDRTQLGLAIQRISNPRTKPLLVTYVHGWHNNSDDEQKSGDLFRFNSFIQRLKANPKYRPYEVTGVYMGWRGESSNVPGIKQLTFWNRNAGAARVANGSMVYSLHRLGAEVRKKSGKSVLVGHSFGGRIVEKSVAQSLIARGQQAGNTPSTDAALPADFIVVINPATESLHARQIQVALNAKPSDPPVMVAIGAMNDQATRFAWPAGAYLKGSVGMGFLNEPDRQYHLRKPDGDVFQIESQHHSFIARTTTNNPNLFTHRFSRENAGVTIPEADRITVGGVPYYLSTEEAKGIKYRIPSTAGEGSNYGYWIFQVPTEILNGHGNGNDGVLSEKMEDLVVALMNRSRVNPAVRQAAPSYLKPKSEFKEIKPQIIPSNQ